MIPLLAEEYGIGGEKGIKKDKRCLGYRKTIKESVAALQTLERRQGKARLRDRMRFLRRLKSGECTNRAEAGKQIGLQRRAGKKLWGKYRLAGVQSLLDCPTK